MKKSTKVALGIGAGVAAFTALVIKAVFGKGEVEATQDCIEGECTDVTDSEESTEEVED